MPRCLLAMGSNLGDRSEQLRAALHEIAHLSKTRLLARSRWIETSSVGGPAGQGLFLNGAALVDTCLTPDVLHGHLLGIEKSLGRQRTERWSPRTLDLDMLLYDGLVCRQADPTGTALELPHPRMSFRRFVLEPAMEIAGWMHHPTSGWTVAQLLGHLNTSAPYVAVTAINPHDARWLAGQLAELVGCPNLELSSLVELALGGTTGPSPVESAQAVVSCPWAPDGFKLPQPRPRLLVQWIGEVSQEQQAEPPQVPCCIMGPVARIDTTNRQQALAEALAAVQAVWP